MVQCIFITFNRSLAETLGGLVQNEAFDSLEDCYPLSLREWRKVLRWVACPAFAVIVKKCIARNGWSDPE
jgi:hypothetical protein